MSPVPWRTLKIGGSLLDYEPLVARLRQWLERQPAARNVIVVGGGEFAEKIRRLDELHRFGVEASHRLCLEAMHLTATLAARLLPEAAWASNIEQLARSAGRPGAVIVDAGRWCAAAGGDSPLNVPASWDVTSDSIAARVAIFVGAEELVLFKSTPAPPGAEIDQLAADGIVDPYFPVASAKIRRVRLVNLRAWPAAETIVRG